MSDENSFRVKLPVRQLPDGTVRVGHEPPVIEQKRFSFPVVPNVTDDGGDKSESGEP